MLFLVCAAERSNEAADDNVGRKRGPWYGRNESPFPISHFSTTLLIISIAGALRNVISPK